MSATEQTNATSRGELITITGRVQGVGFRPSVWRIAHALALKGWVRNTVEGVEIAVWGGEAEIAQFVDRLRGHTPIQSQIGTIRRQVFERPEPGDFTIAASREGAETLQAVEVLPDIATCALCLGDMRDESSRYHQYPFTNCTDCGPRFSIIARAPYDRANTAMAGFEMCRDCQADFDRPQNRRFHAQPIACGDCGPRVWLEEWRTGTRDAGNEAGDAIGRAVDAILGGSIVAIKGLGGFHLACDATQEDAVIELRKRKRRPDKPLALMVRDLEIVRRYCRMSGAEELLLTGPEAPIVLLTKKGNSNLAGAVAPGLCEVGFMLPNTPLHHLLMERFDVPVVMTSGNPSGQPQATENEDARCRLAGIADCGLLHDRDIANQIDDSVVRAIDGKPQIIRRARGYAPASLLVPDGLAGNANVLALGGTLKSTVCLVQQERAILSHHLGDLEETHTYSRFQSTIDLYCDLFRFTPDLIAIDAHPDYLSTKYGQTLAAQHGHAVESIQHHHAHVASCLAENNWPLNMGDVLGVVLDGLGFGGDGTLWGGEFLLANYTDFRRLAHFEPVPLLGGSRAVLEPWRNAYAHLTNCKDWEEIGRYRLPVIERLREQPLATLDHMRASRFNSPLSSSCGRLFDAASALVGLAFSHQSYEGHAAMLLEATIAERGVICSKPDGYRFDVVKDKDALPMICAAAVWPALLSDLSKNISVREISARFHVGLARSICEMVMHLRSTEGKFDTVALSGGCFQNATLHRLVEAELSADGLEVLTHARIPANDGGLALGQAVVALARQNQQGTPTACA